MSVKSLTKRLMKCPPGLVNTHRMVFIFYSHLSCLSVLCPSPGCQIRVRVITSKPESESESSPPSPRVRVKIKKSSPSHESSSPHIQHLFIFRNMKTNNKMYRIQSKQRNTARLLRPGVKRNVCRCEIYDVCEIYDPNPNPNPIPCEILDACTDSPIVIHFASHKFRATPGPSHKSRFLIPSPSPSQSEKKHWTRVRVRVKWTPSSYSSHTALMSMAQQVHLLVRHVTNS